MEEKVEREEKKMQQKRWRDEISNSSSLAKGSYLIQDFYKDACRTVGHLYFVKTCPTLPLCCFVDYATPNVSIYFLISPL